MGSTALWARFNMEIQKFEKVTGFLGMENRPLRKGAGAGVYFGIWNGYSGLR